MLPPQNSVGEPDGSSSSNSPTRQLETLELFLTIGDFDVIGIKLWLESIGWQEFIRAVEALAGVGRMSLELEWEAMKTDTRPWESWEMMRFRSFMPRPGATSVSVIFSTSDETDDYVADLLREKVCQLQDKGIGLRIDFASY
jgi:hypothetical protein